MSFFKRMSPIIGLTVLAACATTPANVTLDTVNQRASYGIGADLGRNISATPGIDLDALFAGVRDVVDGRDLRMTREEIAEALQAFSEQARLNAEQAAAANLEQGQAFLADNASRQGVNTTASGLQYMVLEEGSGVQPGPDSRVTVHYRGQLIDGTPFDSSYGGNPASFAVTGVISGWTEALQLMREGARYRLWVPGNLAYGEPGRPGIPPNSVLIFEVELLAVE